MNRLVFNSKDFCLGSLKVDSKAVAQAQKAFDEWLEKQTVVYGKIRGMAYSYFDQLQSPTDTHKAYLVCIDEIKECEHENVILEHTYTGSHTLTLLKCRDCNKQLKPKNGWEVASE